MNLTFTWINILILFGAFQALIFSFVLVFQNRHPGSKFLAAFVFVFAYNGFETFNWSSGLNSVFFDISAYIIIFAAGPALYFYVKSILTNQKLRRSEITLHFLPFLFELTTRILALLWHLLFVFKVVDNEFIFLNAISFTWTKAEPISMILFVSYVIGSIVEFRTVTSLSIFTLRPEKKPEWNWIKTLLIWSIAVAVGWLATLTVPFFMDTDRNYYPIELLLVAFTYWLAMNGYHKVRLIHSVKEEIELAQSITPADAGMYYKTLCAAMDTHKHYLDPKLNVSKLSQETGIPQKIISAVLNQFQQSNFNDFVNSYRLKAVCQMLTDPNINEKFTISGIAFECGFNSQATFQRVFKNKIGMSPREFAAQQMKQSA